MHKCLKLLHVISLLRGEIPKFRDRQSPSASISHIQFARLVSTNSNKNTLNQFHINYIVYAELHHIAHIMKIIKIIA